MTSEKAILVVAVKLKDKDEIVFGNSHYEHVIINKKAFFKIIDNYNNEYGIFASENIEYIYTRFEEYNE